jgi:hypothetical protein
MFRKKLRWIKQRNWDFSLAKFADRKTFMYQELHRKRHRDKAGRLFNAKGPQKGAQDANT